MTTPVRPKIATIDLAAMAAFEGRVAVFTDEGKLDQAGRRMNRLTRGALERFIASQAYEKLKPGESATLNWPAGMAAEAIQVVRLPRRADALTARKAGTGIGAARSGKATLILAGNLRHADDVILGAMLGSYAFEDHKTGEKHPEGGITAMLSKPGEVSVDALMAAAEGVFFTRDLVNEPSNVLTTSEFAARLAALSSLGVKVEVFEESDLEKLGMRTLLAVGQGSESPSKVVVMHWNGGGSEKPFALVGKGVVFDTGGVSLKPAAGMEDMTMDMGGAGTVAGVMNDLGAPQGKGRMWLDSLDLSRTCRTDERNGRVMWLHP